jgi:hypothetical protein
VHSYAFIRMPTHVPNSPVGRRPRRSRAAVHRFGCRQIADCADVLVVPTCGSIACRVRESRRAGRHNADYVPAASCPAACGKALRTAGSVPRWPSRSNPARIGLCGWAGENSPESHL